jgi:hypothetical protein
MYYGDFRQCGQRNFVFAAVVRLLETKHYITADFMSITILHEKQDVICTTCKEKI